MVGDQMQVKKCTKCNEVKSVSDFEENQYSLDGRYLICMACFAQREKKPPQLPQSMIDNQEEMQSDSVVPDSGVEKKTSKLQQPVQERQPIKTFPESENDEKQATEIKQAQQAILNDTKEVSMQAQGLLPKLRRCNGCKKIEPVDKVPSVPPKPVQAWFCKDCMNNKTHTYAGKGYLVHDFWGRVYKVSKILNNELVLGVVKKGDGRWSTRKFKIYGRWLTQKSL